MSEIYSPGLEGIIAGETAISTIAGGLIYRGYRIEELAAQSCFEEVAYLVLHGELPNKTELAAFRQRLAAVTLHPMVLETLRRLPADVSMMDIMRSVASLLSHFDPDVARQDRDANLRKAERLCAQLHIALAAAYRLRRKQEPLAPRADLDLAANLLFMLHGHPASPTLVKAMDVSWILYAEHEFNASRFTARVVS
jgi:citrate synthase